MKKILSFILSAGILIFGCSIHTYAQVRQVRTIELSDPKITLAIPENFYVLTTDGPIDDYALSLLGYGSRDEWIDSARLSNIYLDAFSSDYNNEIIVTRIDNLISNMSELPDSAIDALIPTLVKMYAAAGYTVENQKIEKINEIKYVILECSGNVNGMSDRFVQHYTIIDSNAINITYHSYSGTISLIDRLIINDVISSVTYGYHIAPMTIPETPSFLFRDEETGTSFTVPSNWTKEALSKERQVLDAKFASTDGEKIILYGSADVWDSLPFLNKITTPRRDYSFSNMSSDEISELVDEFYDSGISLSKESVAGIDYYKSQTTSSQQAYGLELEVTMTQYLTVQNGYGYIYQFSGSEKDSHYQEFCELLRSVEYSYDDSESNIVGIAVVSVISAIVMIVIISAIKKKHKKNNSNTNSDTKESEDHGIPRCFYCSKCGKGIPASSRFCPYCGEKTVR